MFVFELKTSGAAGAIAMDSFGAEVSALLRSQITTGSNACRWPESNLGQIASKKTTCRLVKTLVKTKDEARGALSRAVRAKTFS